MRVYMKEESLKNIAEQLFGDLPGIYTSGLNGGTEFFDSLVSKMVYVSGNSKKIKK